VLKYVAVKIKLPPHGKGYIHMSGAVKGFLVLIIFAVLIGLAVYFVNDKLHPTIDKNNDGKPDEWFAYNIWGELVSLKKDRNYDGKVDHIEEYVNGKISIMRVDMNDNGIFETIMRYDSQGRMLSLERDIDEDGKMDRVQKYDPITQVQLLGEGAENPDSTESIN
jgi:hypothetical protein